VEVAAGQGPQAGLWPEKIQAIVEGDSYRQAKGIDTRSAIDETEKQGLSSHGQQHLAHAS